MRLSLSSGISLMRTLDPSDEEDVHELWDLPDEEFAFTSAMDAITFETREDEADLPVETWRSAAFVRHEVPDSDELQYDDEFVHHPILRRSFFAFPPITQFRVTSWDWDREIAPHNANGVILADVLHNIVEMYVQYSNHREGDGMQLILQI